MPQLNPPDYEAMEEKVIRCLKAWKPGYTDTDEQVALDRLKEIWPQVDWTDVRYIIRATQDAAKFAIAKSAPKLPENTETRKRRGRPPKSEAVKELKEDDEKKIEHAQIDQGVKIE